MKKIIALMLTAVMVMALAACGGSKEESYDATYMAVYDAESGADVLNALPEYQFLPADVRQDLSGNMRLELTLIVEFGTDYTLSVHYFNPDQADTEAADYFDFQWGTLGTCTAEDGVITLETPEMGDATYTAGSDYTSNEGYNAFDVLDFDGTTGSWTSDEAVMILGMVADGTVFTVDGTAITGWEITETQAVD